MRTSISLSEKEVAEILLPALRQQGIIPPDGNAFMLTNTHALNGVTQVTYTVVHHGKPTPEPED